MADDDLSKLFRNLTAVPDLLVSEVRKSFQQTAMETKKAYAKDAAKGVLGSRYSATIDYTIAGVETGGGQGDITAEIGPNLTRYGGKTGKGGLVPSFGIFDDPLKPAIGTRPSRARPKAELFAGDELEKRILIAVDESLSKKGL